MGYKASKVLGAGRQSYSIVFRHPVRKDSSGKAGLRIRRGLGTTDENEAQRLVEQMNEILSDKTLWDLSARQFALLKFDVKIVDAFYDTLEPRNTDYFSLREAALPLPGAEQGYAKVLLVGTTGAGKTTLLRQLIGTDPKKERFPSTSPNKTTVSDIEVICSQGSFETIVTFFELREIRLHLEDCVMAAVLAKINGLDNDIVTMRLLEHSEQRFRFFYVLGDPTMDLDDEDEVDEDEDQELFKGRVTKEENAKFQLVIKGFLSQVNELALVSEKVKNQLVKEFNLNPDSLGAEDKTAFEEIMDEELRQKREFHGLVDDMLDEMTERFKLLKEGHLEFDGEQWPIRWSFRTDDRSEFIQNVRRLSSNYAPHFGKLLTPLVQGIRVKGPFIPTGYTVVPRLVLIDGQGIGHTVTSASSLPSQTSKKFETSDAILLVDSSKQPMQAASQAVLKELASSGHISKLRICFTHLDELKGDNLPTRKSRVNHVSASLNQVVTRIRETLGNEVAVNLDLMLPERSYYLGSLDQNVEEKDKNTLEQLKNLVAALETSIFVEKVSDAIPYYDEANLIIAVQNATRRFHDIWKGRFGRISISNEPVQHWARIKAISRRLALNYDNLEYDNLRPIPELKDRLMDHIRMYLNQPVRWVPGNTADEEKKEAVDRIAREIHSKLINLATERLWAERQTPWNEAFNLTGRGSTVERIKHMESIFEIAAPIPGEAATISSHEYLTILRQLVKDAINLKGGRMLH
ncbi:CpaF/VirB11 family protein [Paenibacillus polymyxa]|uniref:CpaF/VirB11 family protein n=1 Tax=Paenibacillus polymyxa TaxID=1406 RepID=A0AAE9IC24_PAEPO|nr:CpaF/VirB11 family protein [Paenibacillus polymyxa]URJ48740.1 CpaF/VirB11 family protein [Paenibacillus polymyxa]